MKKIFYSILCLIFVACGKIPRSDNANGQDTAKEDAILLRDSAIKIMKSNPDSDAIDQSLALLDQAIEKYPHLEKAYYYKMSIYKKRGEDEKIFETLIERDSQDPGNAYSTLDLGMEYELHGQKEKATAKYDEAVSLFRATLDTLPESSSGLFRNTCIINLAMANALADKPFDLAELKDNLTDPEFENLKIALTTMSGLNRQDLLNLRRKGKSKSSK